MGTIGTQDNQATISHGEVEKVTNPMTIHSELRPDMEEEDMPEQMDGQEDLNQRE